MSKNFTLSITSLSPSPTPAGSLLNINFKLENARGSYYLQDIIGDLTCLNGSYTEQTHIQVLYFTAGLASDSTRCYANPLSSNPFNIYVNLTDDNNNTGEGTFTYYTKASDITTTVPSSPGGGAGPSPPPACTPEATYEINCTDEKDNDCDGATDCFDPDCSDFSACIKKIPNFNFNVTPTQIEILQGEDGTIVGSMTNLGNVQLLLTSSVDIEKDCCSVDMTPSFTVAEKTTTGFNTTIHVNTSTPPGEYVLNFKLSYYALQNSQPVKVIVKENEIISYILKTITSQLPTIISNINDYRTVGVDISYADEKINEIQKLIEDAKIAVQEDDLDSLKQYNDRIKLYMSQIDAELSNLKFTKTLYENKYNIASGIIIGSIAIYVITRVIYPFAKISLEMTKLKLEEASLVASRVKTEKEYFVRKIDESTFRKIVADTHGKVLRLRSTLDLRKQERVNLIKRRLSPLTLGEFIKSKTKKK